MKAETQANKLAALVKHEKKYPEYELILPFVKIKSNSLKKLAVGDVVLLGLAHLELYLLSKANRLAKVDFIFQENKSKIKILHVEKEPIRQDNTKKYKTVKCSFSKLQSRKFEAGFELSTEVLKLQEVTLFIENKNIATATLVNVDDEIAAQVTKVEKI